MNKLTKQNFKYYFAAFFCAVVVIGTIYKTAEAIVEKETDVLLYIAYLCLIGTGIFWAINFYNSAKK